MLELFFGFQIGFLFIDVVFPFGGGLGILHLARTKSTEEEKPEEGSAGCMD